MNEKFVQTLMEIVKDPLAISSGFEKMRIIQGLSFEESVVFWGLTNPESSEECWGRITLNNFFVNTDGEKITPLQREIRQRIIETSWMNKKFNKRVKIFLRKLLENERDIPNILILILYEKFKSII